MNELKTMEVDSASLSTLKLPFNRQVQLNIIHGGRKYHLLLYLRKRTDQLLVISNGAINPKKKKPPVFMRSSWIQDFPGSLIFLDDPTLHDGDLTLGWGQGTVEAFALEEIASFVDVLADRFNYKRENIHFYGSSAGGFMSMIYAVMLEGTSAVVNNPQTNVLNYYPSAVEPLMEHVYGTCDREELLGRYGHRLSILEAFKYYGHVPVIHYFQNQLCEKDLNQHLNPLIKGMQEEGMEMNHLYVNQYFDSDAGHSPLSKEGTIRLLNLAISGNFDYHI
ncbi:S9 family peptidase [Salinicoccus roseus]|uniref:S9 family peptidase n=1 Tax=Salinicoccus roseus TaxID=45670 RepID=UPI001CA67EF2|nr:S9 family peptidase [Salinicoccus roseus]MBY8908340.1 S9 family peptidase [Salinicoccus roseus]